MTPVGLLLLLLLPGSSCRFRPRAALADAACRRRAAVVINALYDDLDDLEDELELAAEEAYLTEAAIEDAEGGTPPAGATMADLEKAGGGGGK